MQSLLITLCKFWCFLLVIWSPKQSEIEESYLESMAKQWKAQKHEESELWSLKVLCHNQSGMQGGEVKRESTLKHSWWQSFQPLLEYFLKSNLCMLYVVSKIGKSTIQCFKRFANQSWNEEVRANGSRSLQAEGQFCRAAKSAFGCEMISQPSCSSAKFRSHFVRLRNSPECFQIFATNVFGYFASDICCLNPNSLLVIHQLDDSLVVKQEYRGKQPVIYCFVIFIL